MKALLELDPHWSDEGHTLVFQCPVCPNGHYIGVPFRTPLRPGGPVWRREGKDFSDITASPSINCAVEGSDCRFHGWVTKGVVTWQ